MDRLITVNARLDELSGDGIISFDKQREELREEVKEPNTLTRKQWEELKQQALSHYYYWQKLFNESDISTNSPFYEQYKNAEKAVEFCGKRIAFFYAELYFSEVWR